MKQRWGYALSVALIAVPALAQANVSARQIVPGQVIVKYKRGLIQSQSELESVYQVASVKNVKRFRGMMKGFEHLFFDSKQDVNAVVARLQQDPRVEYAQPNYIYTIQPTGLPVALNQPKPSTPCAIPGLPYPPGCEDGGDGGGGGGGGENPFPPGMPCLIPGLPFPPGCEDSGGGGGGGGGTPKERPPVADAPADVNPPVADPDLSKAYGIGKVGATEAWSMWKGSKDMVVAVIDTGIDYNHNDLAFNVWRNSKPTKNDVVGYDFVHDDGLPYDDHGHGTHCSGSVGAVGGNGIGVAGVNQRVSIMGIKFLDAQGSGDTANAIKAIDYAVNNGARVLSNSWGGPAEPGDNALKDAVLRAQDKGVLFIAAAGNGDQFGRGQSQDGPNASYPAAYETENMIAVAATDSNDNLASFSNYSDKKVHLSAPGVDVYSLAPGNKYAKMSGTSMATPHVAGGAAFIWSKNPSLTYKQVKDLLLKNVDVVPSLRGKTVTGGRMNVLKALRSM